jgi:hypothetical protein
MEYLGSWFGRRPDTLWNVAEAKALRDLSPPREEVEEMARYRALPNEYHRRNVLTLLNNWTSELDRARAMLGPTTPTKPEEQGPEGWQEAFREIIPSGPIPISWGHIDSGLRTEIEEQISKAS